VHHLRPGDRVVGFYGHRTHAVVRAERVIAVPPEICDKLALLAILSCDVAKGVRKVQPWIGEPVLVTGAGAIGLLAVWLLRALGATAVDVVEPRAERRVLAQRLGARRVYTPHEGDTLDETYAVGLECSSRNAAFALLQAHLRPNGRVCILADGNVEPLVLAPAFHEKELSVVGSSDGWDYHAHAAWYFAIVRQERGALEEIFDRRIVADELMAMFERLATSEETATKVFVWYASPRQSLG
jgi:alcohol dehydrogenase